LSRKGQSGKAFRFDLYYREVCFSIQTDRRSREMLAFSQFTRLPAIDDADINVSRVDHDVSVGYDVAIRVYDHARPRRPLFRGETRSLHTALLYRGSPLH
jgi:hypothetical protein